MMLPRLSLPLLGRAAASALFAFGMAAAAPALGSEPAQPAAGVAEDVNDPLEPINRTIFGINELADHLVLKPAAHTYEILVPDPLQAVVQSVLRNLLSPLIITNELLQGDFEGAERATGRFMTNTIAGLGGIADVASEAGLEYVPEDFGQTLAVWGVGDGPYIVLPLVGPSNLRDATGFVVETVGDPIRLWGVNNGADWALRTRTGATAVDARAAVLGQVEDLRRNSIDYYAAARSLYRQRRDALIEDRRAAPQADFPVFSEEPGRTP